MKEYQDKTLVRDTILTILVIALMAFCSHHASAIAPVPIEHKAESEYVEEWCSEGIIEHVLPDKTRIDCLTEDFAIEFEFAKNWKYSLGQALHYARMTGKKVGIVLIYKTSKDHQYMAALKTMISHYNLPITVWWTK